MEIYLQPANFIHIWPGLLKHLLKHCPLLVLYHINFAVSMRKNPYFFVGLQRKDMLQNTVVHSLRLSASADEHIKYIKIAVV